MYCTRFVWSRFVCGDLFGQRAYRGETDPRKLRLSIAVGFGEQVLRITGVRHARIQDVVFRGATGSPMIQQKGNP